MLDHSYILPLFDCGEQETETTSMTYMVMPYREEGSLSTWLRQRSEKQTLTPQEAAHFIRQAASALGYSHRHQIIHQDVKPSNFLIRNNETNPQLPDLLLADFGVAKFTSASASVSQSSRGTPTYMAPEQWSGQPVAACDQYALAIMAGQLGVSQTLNVPPVSNADIRATVAISRDEIASGTTRTLNPPGGRRITVPIPSGIPDGQVIRFENQGDTASNDTTGVLVLTISVAQDATMQAEQSGNENKTVLSDPGSPKKQMSPPNITESRRSDRPSRRLRLPRIRVSLIIGLVLLIVVVSRGIAFYANNNNTNNSNSGVQNPYPPNSGTLALNDPLANNSRGYSWTENRTNNGACAFTASGYQVNASILSFAQECVATKTNLSNFAFEVGVSNIQGDSAGILFHTDSVNQTFYYFGIYSNGAYVFDLDTSFTPLGSSTTPAINPGQNQSNVIAVVANGTQFNFYVNHQLVDSINDSTYSQGVIGVAVLDNANPTSAVFTNAKVWTF